jgi:hypothetical protein
LDRHFYEGAVMLAYAMLCSGPSRSGRFGSIQMGSTLGK